MWCVRKFTHYCLRAPQPPPQAVSSSRQHLVLSVLASERPAPSLEPEKQPSGCQQPQVPELRREATYLQDLGMLFTSEKLSPPLENGDNNSHCLTVTMRTMVITMVISSYNYGNNNHG